MMEIQVRLASTCFVFCLRQGLTMQFKQALNYIAQVQ